MQRSLADVSGRETGGTLPSKGGERMSDFFEEPESGEELIDEEGRNVTQRRIDEETDPTGEERRRWDETNDEPAEGEAEQDSV
jgi:hypothetical protein